MIDIGTVEARQEREALEGRLGEFLAAERLPLEADAVLEAFSQLATNALVGTAVAGTPLRPEEAALLETASGTADRPGAAARARARSAVKSVSQYASALSTSEVAHRLGGKSTSRVRHLARGGGLYAVPADRRSGLRFPAWQFTAEGQPLPGLRQVLAALPRDLHPLQVAGFFSTPAAELSLGDEPVSPAGWLANGGDPAVVADLASRHDETP